MLRFDPLYSTYLDSVCRESRIRLVTISTPVVSSQSESYSWDGSNPVCSGRSPLGAAISFLETRGYMAV